MLSPGYTPHQDTRLRLLSKLWADQVTEVHRNDFGLSLSGPQIAIDFLKDEMELGRLENIATRKKLSEQLEQLDLKHCSNCPDVKALLSIISSQVSKGRSEYLGELIKKASQLLDDERFIKSLVNSLKCEILSSQELKMKHIDSIRWIICQIIIYYMLKGFELKSIEHFPNEVFFSRTSFSGPHFFTEYPFGKELTSFEVNDTDACSIFIQNERLLQALSDLTIEIRFNALTNFVPLKEKFVYIFPLKGMKGNEKIEIGNVCIYPPAKFPLAANEGWQREISDSEHPDALNASVTFLGGNTDDDRQEAARIIRTHLDILSMYCPTREPLDLITQRCTLLDENGKIRASYSEAMLEEKFKHEHLYIDTVSLHRSEGLLVAKTLLSSIRNQHTTADRQLSTALTAFRKANSSDAPEDRILNYWIAIEALFSFNNRDGFSTQEAHNENVESIALQVIPASLVNRAPFSVGWELFEYMSRQLSAIYISVENPFSAVPPELMSNCGLISSPGALVELSHFINCLENLAVYISHDEALFSKIAETIEFYTNARRIKNVLDRRFEQAYEDVVFIYQIRNRIVHNAHSRTKGISYFAERAKKYVTYLFSLIFSEINKPRSEIFAAAVAECVLLRKTYETKTDTFDFLRVNS